jgi:DNA-binding transcriptional regulator YdaS (Cro superfamily)
MEAFIKYLSSRVSDPMSDIAEDLGVSRPYIYDLKSGRRVPSLTLALSIESKTGGSVRARDWPNIATMMQALDAA